MLAIINLMTESYQEMVLLVSDCWVMMAIMNFMTKSYQEMVLLVSHC